jgi:hypothetical protein
MIRRIATGATIALSCLYLGLAVIPAEMGFAVAIIGILWAIEHVKKPRDQDVASR